MTIVELIPIGTVIALLTTEVLETALAAQDVLIEKESFRTLSTFLQDIRPLLVDLRQRELKESPAVRVALESLQEDLKKARALIDNCTNKPKMYLLVNCRSIVREAQSITRNVGKSLQLLALASAEVAVDISISVSRLKDQMINAEFHASESKLVVINKLEQGLREHRIDQGFANDLLLEIARVMGIPVNASEISRELASFKKEKEEAALRKEREEESFMEQVITLLSRGDSAFLPRFSNGTFISRGDSMLNAMNSTELIPPLKSFICPLKQDVMVDPVSLVTGSCFERSAITEWFANGNTTDPITHQELQDRTLRSNIPIRQSIEEWQERNYCIGIQKSKAMLQSRDESKIKAALESLSDLCRKSKSNKDWIAEEGLVVDVVNALKSSSRDVKRAGLSALHALVENNTANKERVADAGGLDQIVRCLGRETSVASSAAALLSELLEGNAAMSGRIGRERTAIFLLVTLLKGKDAGASQLAKLTLHKLSSENDNVVQMAAANWLTPLIACLCEGNDESSKLAMVKALASMKLTHESEETLANLGAIVPLVRMMDSDKIEIKSTALSALQNLCSNRLIKSHVAQAGGIPVVLRHLFSGQYPASLTESAAAILDHVAANDGMTFFVDGDGVPLDEGQTVENLLAVQENYARHLIIRRHLLHVLLGLVATPEAKQIRGKMRSLQGITLLLPLVEGSDRELRDSVIQILHHLSGDSGSEEIAQHMQNQKKFQILLHILNSSTQEDVQVAAAGILGSLSPHNPAITVALEEAQAIPALVNLLRSTVSSGKVNEAAVGALVRFTEPSNVKMQQSLANLDAHALLVRLLYSGTIRGKARAATALKNFSLSTPSLSVQPVTGWWCYGRSRLPKCNVHCGRCDVKTTFCIVEADAVAGLVALLNEDRGAAAVAAVEALETLVNEDEFLQAGAQLLHSSDAISPILDILTVGTPELKEKAVIFLERIFVAKGMKEIYGNRSRIPLVDLATYGRHSEKKRAAKVLAQLEYIHEVSTYY